MQKRIERAQSIVHQGTKISKIIFYFGIIIAILFSLLVYEMPNMSILAAILGGLGVFSGYYILYLITSTFIAILDQNTLTNERLIELEKERNSLGKSIGVTNINDRVKDKIFESTEQVREIKNENNVKENNFRFEGKEIIEISVDIVQILTNTTYEAIYNGNEAIVIETDENLKPFINKSISIMGSFIDKRNIKLRNSTSNSARIFLMKEKVI